MFFKPLESIANEPIFLYILGYISLLILNFIRYLKFTSYSKLEKQWHGMNKTTKRIVFASSVCYILLSGFLFYYSDDTP